MSRASLSLRHVMFTLAFCLPALAVLAADAPAGDTLLVYGKDKTDGNKWVQPEKDANYLKSEDAAGKDGGPALHWHGEAADWMGIGWNWHSWWPSDGGDDISAKKNLHFWIKTKVSIDNNFTFTVCLVSSNAANPEKAGHTGTVMLADYDAKWADGQWHEITIPLADLLKGMKDDTKFDATKAWEFDMGSWAADTRVMDAWVSDIGFTGTK